MENPNWLDEALKAWLLLGTAWLVAFWITSCAPLPAPELPANPLSKQILTVHPDYPGSLFHRRGQEVKNYPLSDAAFRKQVNEFRFMCKIGGKSFKVCLDKPGFCRHTVKKSCFLFFCKESERIEEYKDSVKDFQFLLNGSTKCAPKEIYPELP